MKWTRNKFLLSATSMMMAFALCISAQAAQKAADFELQDVNGNKSTLTNALKDKKAVLLNFWATWCPSCRKEIPAFVMMRHELAGRGFDIIGIDVGESARRVEAFANKYAVDYPILLDEHSETAEKYKIVGLPRSILVDGKGNVIGTYSEYDEKMRAEIEKALS